MLMPPCMCLDQNTNTCPVDRQPFTIILVRHPGEEVVFKRVSHHCQALLPLYACTVQPSMRAATVVRCPMQTCLLVQFGCILYA